MRIRIKCAICDNDLPIIKTIQHKITIDYHIGLCGYCETMAHKVKKELETLNQKNTKCQHVKEEVEEDLYRCVKCGMTWG